MDENEYLEDRLQGQIDWYDRKSQSSQRWFKRLRVFELIAAAGIPFMAGYSGEFEYLTPVVGFLGVLVAVVAGLLSLNQFQEHWVEYRTTCEALKREKYLFLAKVYPYDGERSFPMLVQNVESLLAKETSAWGQYMRVAGKQKEETPSGAPEPASEQPLPLPETNAGRRVVAEGTGPSESVVEQVEDAISITKNVAQGFPKEVGGALQEISTQAEEGLAIFTEATEVVVVPAAVTAAQDILGASPQPSMLKAIVQKSLGSFAPVLGTAAPPIALIMALGTVGANLGRAAYEKWKARILHLPFSPAAGIPLVVDANTGFNLLQQSPILAAAFSKAMADGKFSKDAALEFVRKTDVEALWQKYRRKGQFASREEFEQGLEEFRRAAAEAELETAIDPTWLSEAGGYQQLLGDVDAIHFDPEARQDLQELVTTIERLHSANDPVLDLLNEIRKEKNL